MSAIRGTTASTDREEEVGTASTDREAEVGTAYEKRSLREEAIKDYEEEKTKLAEIIRQKVSKGEMFEKAKRLKSKGNDLESYTQLQQSLKYTEYSMFNNTAILSPLIDPSNKQAGWGMVFSRVDEEDKVTFSLLASVEVGFDGYDSPFEIVMTGVEAKLEGGQILPSELQGNDRLHRIFTAISRANPYVECTFDEAPSVLQVLLEYCNPTKTVAKVYAYEEAKAMNRNLRTNNDFNRVGHVGPFTYTVCTPVDIISTDYPLNFKSQSPSETVQTIVRNQTSNNQTSNKKTSKKKKG